MVSSSAWKPPQGGDPSCVGDLVVGSMEVENMRTVIGIASIVFGVVVMLFGSSPAGAQHYNTLLTMAGLAVVLNAGFSLEGDE